MHMNSGHMHQLQQENQQFLRAGYHNAQFSSMLSQDPNQMQQF